jgi:hypothetical protein
MDYGIISLLIIQLAACAGCIVAWLRIRGEVDRIKSGIVSKEELAAHVNLSHAGLAKRMDEIEIDGKDAASTLDIAEKAHKTAREIGITVEEHGDAIRSIRASLAAFKRHRGAEPVETETTPPFPPVEQEEMFAPIPPLTAPVKNSTFGKLGA